MEKERERGEREGVLKGSFLFFSFLSGSIGLRESEGEEENEPSNLEPLMKLSPNVLPNSSPLLSYFSYSFYHSLSLSLSLS